MKVDISGQLLVEFINQIEEDYPLKFYYRLKDIENIKVPQDCENKLLNDCLEDVCRANLLGFYRNGNSIFIFKGSPVNETLGKTDGAAPSTKPRKDTVNNLDIIRQKAYKIHTIGTPGKTTSKTVLLKGVVTEFTSGEPVSNANVILAGTSKGVSTNQKGYFEIQLPVGNNTLQFSSVGMEPTQRIINIYSSGRLEVEMETKVNLIGDVEIFGEQNAEISKVFSGVELFEGKMLESLPTLLGEPDIIKSTLMLPGVATVGEGTVGFNVRGGKTDQNLILIDDAPIFYPSHFFGNFSAINSDMVNNAVLYKGSIPSKYGGRISSVYEINTKDGTAETISGVGGVGLFSARLMVEGPLTKNSGFIFSSRSTYSDWLIEQIKIPDLYNSSVGFNDFQGKINLQLNPKNRLEIGAYLSNDKFRLRSDSLYRYKNLVSSAEWEHTYNENWQSGINFSYSNFSYNISSRKNPQRAFEMTHDVAYYGFKNYNEYNNNKRFKMYFGMESVWYSVNPGELQAFQQSDLNSFYSATENALEYGVFAGAEYPITPLLSLETGVRWSGFFSLDDGQRYLYAEGFPLTPDVITDTIKTRLNTIKKQYHNPEFRLSANYILGELTSLKLSYNKTLQYIHMLTNTTAISPTDTWKLSDEYLPPQIGNQLSAGISKKFRNSFIEVSLEGYYKHIDNIKEYKPGASLLLNNHIETEILNGVGKAYGVEFSLKKRDGRLSGWLGYTWSRTLVKSNSVFPEEEINNGDFFPASYDKPHNLNVFANLKATRRIILSTTLNYTTGRPITYPIAKYQLGDKILVHYSKFNQYRVPDYFRMDFSVTFKGNLKSDKLIDPSVVFSVYNLTARKNAYSVYFKSSQYVLQGYKLSIFGTAIPTVTLNLKF